MDHDDALMVRYAGGDASAFEELYDRYEDRVYGFCLRMTGNPDAAADAFQDTFRRAVEARDRFQPRGRFESWLFTLARRACADLLRNREDHASLEEMSEGKRGRAGRSRRTAGGRRSGSEDPAERAERREEARRLLAILTPGQREALVLHRYHGFTYAEIAEMTGSTEAAVKQKAYRALKRLREER